MIHRIRQHSIHATISSFRALEQQALLPSCHKFLSSFCYEGAAHRQASCGRGVAIEKAAQALEDTIPASLPWAYNSSRPICTSLASRAVPAVSADNLLAELQEAEEEQSRYFLGSTFMGLSTGIKAFDQQGQPSPRFQHLVSSRELLFPHCQTD